MSDPSSTNVRVLLRVRPFNTREEQLGRHTCLTTHNNTGANNTIEIATKPEPRQYAYDHVVDSSVEQHRIFTLCGKPITDTCLKGYNGTIFAYGQTGSGKSYTISGPSDPALLQRTDLRGLMPRVFEHLFTSINDQTNDNKKFTVKVSFLEIYQEKIYDLLDLSVSNTSTSQQSLTLREDTKSGVFVEGLTEHVVANIHDCVQLMNRGTANRRVGETAMNRNSSRSHSVFTISIHSTEINKSITTSTYSKFNLIDLAGSERQKMTQASGTQLKEASNINQSLSALGNVIMSLADKARGKDKHIAYRDSTLTFLLRDSIGGNSLTYVIACVSPAADSFAETLSTLQFASRAKSVRNNAVVNQNQTASVNALQNEILRLQAELAQQAAATSNRRMSLAMPPPVHMLSHRTPRKHNTNGLLSIDDNGTVIDFEVLHEQSLAREAQWSEQVNTLQSEMKQLNTIISAHEAKQQTHTTVLKVRDDTIKKLEQQLAAYTNNKSNSFIQESTLRERLRLQDIELAELRRNQSQTDNVMVQQQKLSIEKLHVQVNELQSALFLANNQRQNNVDVTPMKRQRIDSSAKQHSVNYSLTKKLINTEKQNRQLLSELSAVKAKYDEQYTQQIAQLQQTIEEQASKSEELNQSAAFDAKVRVELFAKVKAAEQALVVYKAKADTELQQLTERYELMVHRDTSDQQVIEQLHSQLSTSINQCYSLTAQIEAASIEHVGNINAAQAQLSETTAALASAQQQLLELQNSNSVAASELSAVVQQLKHANEQAESIQAELHDTIQTLELKQSECSQLITDKQQLAEQLHNKTIEFDQQYFALSVVQEDIETYMETHRYDEQQIEQLQSQLTTMQSEVQGVHAQLQQANDRLSELANSNVEKVLNEQIAELQQSNVQLGTTVSELQQQVGEHVASEQTLTSHANDLATVNSAMQAQLSQLHDSEVEWKEQVHSLQADITTYKSQMSELNDDVEQARSQLEVAEAEADERALQYAESLDGMNDMLRNAEAMLQGKQAEWAEQLSAAQAQYADMQVQLESVQQRCTDLTQQCEHMHQQSVKDVQRMQLIEQQKDVAEQSLAAINNLTVGVDDDNTGVVDSGNPIENKLRALLAEKQQLQQSVIVTEAQLNSALSTLAAAQELVSAVNAERDSLQETHAAEQAELQARLDEVSNQCAQLSEQVTSAEAEKQQAVARVTELEQQVVEQSDLIETIQAELTESTDDSASMEQQVIRLTAELQRSVADKHSWVSELEAAHKLEQAALSKLDAMRAECSGLTDQVTKLTADVSAMTVKNSALTDQIAGLIGHQNTRQKIKYVSELKAENDTLQSTVHKLESQAVKLRQQLLRASAVPTGPAAAIDVQRYNSDVKDVLAQAEREAAEEQVKQSQAKLTQQQLDLLVQTILPIASLADVEVNVHNGTTGKRQADAAVLADRTNKRQRNENGDIKIAATRSKSTIGDNGAASTIDVTVEHSVAIVNALISKFKSAQTEAMSKQREIGALQQQVSLLEKKQELLQQQELMSRRAFNDELDESEI